MEFRHQFDLILRSWPTRPHRGPANGPGARQPCRACTASPSHRMRRRAPRQRMRASVLSRSTSACHSVAATWRPISAIIALPEPLVHVLERVRERLVDGHERRKRESEQRHRLAVRLHHHDADERQHDHQPVERPLDRVRGAALPGGRRRNDRPARDWTGARRGGTRRARARRGRPGCASPACRGAARCPSGQARSARSAPAPR